MTRAAVLALGAILAAAPPAGARIVGVVVDATGGAPVAGVSIVVEASGARKPLAAPTGADGSFDIDPAALFAAAELETTGINLVFQKDDYRTLTRVLRSRERGKFEVKDFKVQIERVAGAAALDAAARQPLEALKSADGRTLYFIPYKPVAAGADANLTQLNQTLAWHLRRGIITHLQSLDVDPSFAEVAVADIPATVAIEPGNSERVRAFGAALNALAVVGGITAVEPDGVAVSSEYVIIPALDQFRPGTLFVDDKFSPEELRSTHLFERLNALWGRNTVLALCVLEIQHALAAKDKAKLTQARSYLVAERSQAAQDNQLSREITRLIEVVDKGLAP